MELFTVIAFLLSLTAVFAYVNERFLRLESSIGLLILAVAFSVLLVALDKVYPLVDLVDAERRFVSQMDLSETLLNGVLCFMLFAGSVNVRLKPLEQEKWLVGSLALVSTFLAWVLIGVMLWGLSLLLDGQVSPIYLFLFGALIAPTDPIAALAILGKAGLPAKLEAVINGESLFNDGVGVVLFTVCLGVALNPVEPSLSEVGVLFLREVLGGIALGLLGAGVMYFMLHGSEHYGTQIMASLGVISLAYVLADHLEVSGPIACVVTGLAIGNFARPRMEAPARGRFDTFWEGIDDVLNSLLFVVIGLNIVLIQHSTDFLLAGIAIAVCLIARAISVHIPIAALRRLRLLKTQGFGLTKLLTWSGLRGGLALALALSLPDGADKTAVLYMTYAVVTFSIIVQGLTITRFFKPDYLATLLK